MLIKRSRQLRFLRIRSHSQHRFDLSEPTQPTRSAVFTMTLCILLNAGESTLSKEIVYKIKNFCMYSENFIVTRGCKLNFNWMQTLIFEN